VTASAEAAIEVSCRGTETAGDQMLRAAMHG
jgi:hypothetical protein